MDWIEVESFWLDCPSFADELVGCETFEGLQSPAEVIGGDEVSEVAFELCVVVIVIALDGRVFDGAVHPLDLPVGPRMVHLGQSMLDVVLVADAVEDVLTIVDVLST